MFIIYLNDLEDESECIVFITVRSKKSQIFIDYT